MATTVDLTFDRAVDLVHSLPKTSPIQIGYEEFVISTQRWADKRSKLNLYALYKRGAAVKAPHPR